MSAPDLDAAVRVLLSPSGDPAAGRAKEDALAVLSTDPAGAHARLEAIATREADAPPAVLIALARLGAPEGVRVLGRVLRTGSDPTTVAAGQALAAHRLAEAREALEAALDDPRPQVVASAALGLAERRESSSIAPLRRALSHPVPEVRARIASAIEEIET